MDTHHLLRPPPAGRAFGAGSDRLEVSLRYQGYVAALGEAGRTLQEHDVATPSGRARPGMKPCAGYGSTRQT
ncbi:MAG: hypothetical protein IPK16_33245 [Anaerolineales bacterium]|nr:hypothetical protein [Anaerolineales bacterium]